MKKTLQRIAFLFVGLLLVSSCSEQKKGESVKQIVDKIEIIENRVVEDSIPLDSLEDEEPEIVEPAPSPAPLPPDPWPDPEPIPGPVIEPVIWPNPPVPPDPKALNPVVDFPDTGPIYPGDSPGNSKEMNTFIMNNIIYPPIDMEMGNQGRVFVEFIVEKDGSLSNIKLLRGVSASIDKEALRIIHLMPNWKPGESGGRIVRTKARLPISFRLD